MTATQSVELSPTDVQHLDNCLRAHRGASVLVLGAPSPMEAFQKDLAATAERMGFRPEGPGQFGLSLQAGGVATLCWH